MTDTGAVESDTEIAELVTALLDGQHRALARAISKIEDREPGYRDLVSRLYEYTGTATTIGVTGSPGAGKSTLVDKLAATYRDRGETVGVIAVDPSSPYTGGAVLGDRIRMGSNVGDMDVFFRSMSARGQLGGLATATADAIRALDAFGKDRIIIETVGAGQNEIDVVRAADTVAVLVQPGSGDDVQTLKAGILEIGDLFIVNKADMDGANRTTTQLEEMIHLDDNSSAQLTTGHHGSGTTAHATQPSSGDGDGDHDGGEAGAADDDSATDEAAATESWTPAVVETVAIDGTGVEELLDAADGHRAYLEASGTLQQKRRRRHAEEIRRLLQDDVGNLLEDELERHGGVDALAEQVANRETDPYTAADQLLAPLEGYLEQRDHGDTNSDPDPDLDPDSV
ncbi:MAG: LAO/AO transport system ATPase [uncultured archaeon A07HR60]|nr:MAG: LAO/AO transport system ATPase [Halorubrum sp. J07HR59]ESS11628.1 MAG: LAO/AO transport system ATPase [uncultured archaeon A07HR60]